MSEYNEASKIDLLVSSIKKKGALLAAKKATAGFDGFVDTIVKIIRSKPVESSPVFFNQIKEFGDYIQEKQGASFSLEIEEINSKSGGNMPIMANALGRLGITVNCVGALGYPQPHPAFKDFPPQCRVYGFADPGTSTAFEFNDGKIMLAQMGTLNKTGWDKIKEVIGIDTLISVYQESDLLCILNWSEIDTSTGIWKGLLKDVFPGLATSYQNKIAFFDLSDCSKRSNGSIKEALDLLKEFAKYAKVILSLNKNETKLVYAALYNEERDEDMQKMGKGIFEKIGPGILLLHSSKESFVINKEGITRGQSFFVNDPRVSTGAGDNFNAGFAIAQILELDAGDSLLFANSVAAFYVQSGISPGLVEVEDFLNRYGVVS